MATNRFADSRSIIGILLFTLVCEGASISHASVILSSTPGDNFLANSVTGFTPLRGTQTLSSGPINFTGAGIFPGSPSSLQMNNQVAGPTVVSVSAASSVTVNTSNGDLIVTQPAQASVNVLSQGSSYSASGSASMQLKFSVTDPFETVQVSTNGVPFGGTEVLSLTDLTAGTTFWANNFFTFPFPVVPTTPLTVGDIYEFSYSLGASTTTGLYSYGATQGSQLSALNFTVMPTPEPASMSVILFGFVGLLARRRLRL